MEEIIDVEYIWLLFGFIRHCIWLWVNIELGTIGPITMVLTIYKIFVGTI